MADKAKMTAGKIISLALVVLLIITAVGFAAYFSNGFTSEFKTFYVECNGEKILNDKDYYEMSANEEYCFDVKYLFDVGNKENKLGYHVKILPHTTKETNFDFTADGKTYNYGAEGELTQAFEIEQADEYFTLKATKTVKGVLETLYPNKTIIVPDLKSKTPYFALVVSSEDYSAEITIAFVSVVAVTGVTLDPDHIVFGAFDGAGGG